MSEKEPYILDKYETIPDRTPRVYIGKDAPDNLAFELEEDTIFDCYAGNVTSGKFKIFGIK